MIEKKLLVIVGPTAIGKTKLGINLARKFSGELISADSRQVYQEMDIGTGKDISNSKFIPHPPAGGADENSKLKEKIQKLLKSKINLGVYKTEGISIWGLDLVKPDQKFSCACWVAFARKIIRDIWQRGKLPVIIAGNGFWLKALLYGVDSLGIPPDWKLRKKLEKLEIKKLREELGKVWPERLTKMNESDRNNPRRLIRAIEISFYSDQTNLPNKSNSFNQANYDLLIVGLKANKKTIYQRIDQRVKERIKQGAEKEVKKLIKKGYKWNLPALSALGYKEWQPFFTKSTTLVQVIKCWQNNEHAYARRQLTWFKKLVGISWFNVSQKDWQKKVEKLIKSWYYKNNGQN